MAGILHPRPKLIPNLSNDARCHFTLMLLQKSPDYLGISLRKLSQCPRQGLHHHVVPVAKQLLAHTKRPFSITTLTARFAIQRNGRDQRRTAQPSIRRADPLIDQRSGICPSRQAGPETYSENVSTAPQLSMPFPRRWTVAELSTDIARGLWVSNSY